MVAKSKEDQVYEELRHAITSNRWLPGVVVTIEILRAHVGAGITPVRDAAHRLVDDGLLERSSTGRFRINDLSRDDLWEIIEIRTMFEVFAVGRAIESLENDRIFEKSLETIRKQMKEVMDKPGPIRKRRSIQLDKQLHRMIVDRVRNIRLQTMYKKRVLGLFEQVLKLQEHSLKSIESTIDEHIGIVDAMLARCTGEAKAKLEEHLANSWNRIEDWLVLKGCCATA